MEAGFAVRDAVAEDLTGVGRIYRHYVLATAATFEETPPDDADWSDRWRAVIEHGLPFLVAADASGVLGYGYCTPWRTRPAYRHTVENSVYVAPGARDLGVGTALLGALLERCAAAGVLQVIAVIADTGDPASVRLHARRGFVEVGRLVGVGYKHGRWLDTVLMQRTLTPDGAASAERRVP